MLAFYYYLKAGPSVRPFLQPRGRRVIFPSFFPFHIGMPSWHWRAIIQVMTRTGFVLFPHPLNLTWDWSWCALYWRGMVSFISDIWELFVNVYAVRPSIYSAKLTSKGFILLYQNKPWKIETKIRDRSVVAFWFLIGTTFSFWLDFKISYIYVNLNIDFNSSKRKLNLKWQHYCTQIGS
jgi:hypothetical protein